ncbi:ABC transporter, substrate-binding protein, family 7 [Bacteriovorax sp. BSW11_IV]|uniref:TRAP transporter substrate-binding protein n=1 Tax=Bacteriovorax sp. BSW11_IV TaxID=1353529 RepID=UPI00038A41F5|nr:TRAP transporter substrate-binding protein DctP [Bacteriovorax sp. BSW11_IV]EQC46717.1 ABC transporter, substrate-binding protein, family 7 [Bacteriovorax sp. BSW11_IV]
MKGFLFGLALLTQSALGATFKLGVVAPEGTNWAKNLKKMASEVKEATGGAVNFKIYYGGSQGDEPDVLRKIRVGQLQGGIFTGKTLGDINGDVRVVEIPFTFYDNRVKALATLEKMAPYFNKKFDKENFTNLGFFEIGLVYFVSQKKTGDIASLNGLKIWSWEGDQLVTSMIETMNLISVPLPLPDVLSSLSTGIVEAAYAPPLGILSLQWNTKVKYIVDFPVAYSVGAFLLDKKKWDKVSPENRKKAEEICDRYIKEINKVNSQDNTDALAAMKSMGIEFLEFPKTDVEKGKGIRAEIVKKLTGKLFSAEALKMLEKEM